MRKLLLALLFMGGISTIAHAECIEAQVNRTTHNFQSVNGASVTWMGKSDCVYSVNITSSFGLNGSLTLYDAVDAAGQVSTNVVGGPYINAGFYTVQKRLRKGLRLVVTGSPGAWDIQTYDIRSSSQTDHEYTASVNP